MDALAALGLPEGCEQADRNPMLAEAARSLVSYFEGAPSDLDSLLDLADETEFSRAVLLACSRIKWGRVLSYGDIASEIGREKAARAVGQVMSRNPLPPFVPCHRVIGADGSLTGFGGGLGFKARMLELEGQKVGRNAAGKWRVARGARTR